jgi:putative transposase
MSGKEFVDQVKAMGIKQVLSAPRSPWQRAYIERMIGSIRRECLDHVIVFGEGSLHRTLTAYLGYYHEWRTHLSQLIAEVRYITTIWRNCTCRKVIAVRT